MQQTIALVWQQVIVSGSILRYRAAQLSAAAALIITVLAIILAPNASPTAWEWSRALIIAVLGIIAVVTMVASREPGITSSIRQYRLTGAGTLLVIALIINVTFGLSSALIFAFGLALITVQAVSDRLGRRPWLLCISLCTLIPFWVWTALRAWDAGLLLLVPLAALALMSDEHMRAASSDQPPDATPLTTRAHRLASWLGVITASIVTVAIGLVSGVSSTWIIIGGIGAIALIATDAGLIRSDDGPRLATLLCDGAFAWLAFCWLASL